MASRSCTDAHDTSHHEEHTDAVQVTDLLTKCEVEADDIDKTSEGEEGRDNTLVDPAELSEVPSVSHHDEVAHVDGDVAQEGDQV